MHKVPTECLNGVMWFRALAFVLAAIACTAQPALPAATTAPPTSPGAVSTPAASASPTTAAARPWRGYYFEYKGPMTSAFDYTLRYAEGSLPGGVVSTPSTSPIPERWSPRGDRILVSDIQGQRTFVVTPGLQPRVVATVSPRSWHWLTDDSIASLINGKLVIVDANDGRERERRDFAVPTGPPIDRGPGYSPDGRWVTFHYASARAPEEARTVELSTAREVSSGPETWPLGWLGDGRFVFGRQAGAVQTIEARRPDATAADVLARFESGERFNVLAEPHSVVLVLSRPGELFTLRPGNLPRRVLGAVWWERRPPAEAVFLHAVSADGRYVSFTRRDQVTQADRTGVKDLETGAEMFACDIGCFGLQIR